MYEWLLIITTHVHSGSTVTMEKFATQNDCNFVKNFFISSYNNSGVSIETTKNGELSIACLQVRALYPRSKQ